MSTKVNGVKGALAKATVLGNGVENKKETATVPLILLPTELETKPQKVKPQEVKKKTDVKEQKEEDKVRETTVTTAQKRLSIDELTDKADRIYLLKEKYSEIRTKRKQLESFTISHDNSNAQLTLVDANGLSISTSNPVAIGKLLADWAIDLNGHLEKTENEIRLELEKYN